MPRTAMELILCCTLSLTVCSAAANDTLVLNNVNAAPFTTVDGDGFLDRVAKDAFARAGRRLRLVSLPAERGLRNANLGIEDGDLTRIAGMEQGYPNLVPVPEKIMDWRFSAFTRNPALSTTTGWSSLLPYKIGVIKGWKIAEKNLEHAKQIIYVDDVDQLFRLLDKNRVDAVVYSHEMGEWYIKQRGLKDVHLLKPALDTREMFIYLHKKHLALIPELARGLRALKTDGSYARYYRESLTRVPAQTP